MNTLQKQLSLCALLFFGMESLLYGQDRSGQVDVIPEVLEIMGGDEVPEDLFLENRNDLRRFATSLIFSKHLHTSRNAHPVEQVGLKARVFETAEVQMMIHAEYLDVILTEGFLNQHQTLESGFGEYSPLIRRRLEHSLLGVNLTSKPVNKDDPRLFLYPKYAFAVSQNPTDWADIHLTRVRNEIVVVFKSDILTRTTWTSMDSIEAWHRGDKIRANTFYSDTMPYVARGHLYAEAQIWGPLDVSDVKEWLVSPNCSKQILQKLKETNLPIFEYVHQNSYAGGVRKLRTKQIFKPSGSVSMTTCKKLFKRKK